MFLDEQLGLLLGWIAITFAAATLGAWASTSAASFYASLVLPSWAPPARVFGPVWTLLYAMMAIAALSSDLLRRSERPPSTTKTGEG